MKNLLLFCIIILLFKTLILNAQPFGTGALLDQSKFELATKAPPLSRGNFVSLPKSFSLKKYAPTPGNQGNTATCTGWAISYGARTILEAINNNWDSSLINKNTFSPSYVYNQIRPREGCLNGTSLVDGLNLIKNDGVLPFQDFGYDCEREVEKKDKMKASNYRIKEYREILNRNSKNKVLNVKKSISQNKPVVIGINCPESFYTVNSIWQPKKDEYNKNVNGHAVTVIGYNDTKEDGAFEIINSWGVNWGDSGFAWIKYSDFNHFCVWAAELIGNKSTSKFLLDANIYLKKVNGERVKLISSNNVFSTKDTFYTGDMFQLFIQNLQPAYLYIFGVDELNGISFLFPNDSLTSEFLAYSENKLIIPSEELAFELDQNTGLSSLLLLFSTEKVRENLNHIFTNSELKKYLSKFSVRKGQSYRLSSKNEIIISDSLNMNWMSFIEIDIKHAQKERKAK